MRKKSTAPLPSESGSVILVLNNGVSVEIDQIDAPRVCAKKWRASIRENGAIRIVTACGGRNNATTEHLGHFILRPPAGRRVILRHRPVGRLHFDYRRENLRVGGQREMRLASEKRTPKTSRYRGVSFDRERNFWRATIKVEGRSIFLGKFNCEIAAAQAYDEASRKHFGDLGFLNFRADREPTAAVCSGRNK